MTIELKLTNKTRYHEIIKKYRSKGYNIITYRWRLCELEKGDTMVVITR